MTRSSKAASRLISHAINRRALLGYCGIGVASLLSISACSEDFCARFGPDRARLVLVSVDTEIIVSEVSESGACKDLVEVTGSVGYREWETEMTGAVGSTCTVRVTSGTNIREATTKLRDDAHCGYPGADAITFIKE